MPIMAGPFESNEYLDTIPIDKKLDPAWVRSLLTRGEKQVYTDREALMHIGMPVGGDIEYTDEVTLGRSFAGRREVAMDAARQINREIPPDLLSEMVAVKMSRNRSPRYPFITSPSSSASMACSQPEGSSRSVCPAASPVDGGGGSISPLRP